MDDIDDVIAEFLVESAEGLDQVDQDLLELETNHAATGRLASTFRTIHTIKGTCGFLAFTKLEGLAHAGENLLSKLRDGELEIDTDIISALLEMVDAVRSMLSTIENEGNDGQSDYEDLIAHLNSLAEPPEAEEAEAAPAKLPLGEVLVHQGVADADDIALALAEQSFGDQRRMGQILIDHGVASAEQIGAAMAAQDEIVKPAGESKKSIADSSVRVDVTVLDRVLNLVGELVLSRNNILQHLGVGQNQSLVAATQRLDTITGELHESVMRTRMQPISVVWSKFPRVVRDLAQSCGKQVRVEMEGEDTELDRTVLDAIRDPLVHIIRNSVDHGIEPAEDRIAMGKAPEGTLHMNAFHDGGMIVIEVTDDGGGIDTERVLQRAVEKGLITPDRVPHISEREAVMLIFEPGFSTAATITNVSGRGVGMDVVKTNIERIGGSLEVLSEFGHGTTLRIKIPLTLAIVPGLTVLCGGARYVIPQTDVIELVAYDSEEHEDVEMVHDAPVLRLRGDILPLVRLHEQLGVTPHSDGRLIVVIVGTADQRFGLVVDHVMATEEIVVKPLGRLMRQVPCFSGATIMGDGEVALILDVSDLARIADVETTHQKASRSMVAAAVAERSRRTTRESTLILEGGHGTWVALPCNAVDRLEELTQDAIEVSEGHEVIQYRGSIVPLIQLSHLGPYPSVSRDRTELSLVMLRAQGRSIALEVESVIDIIDHVEPAEPGGPIVVRGRVTDLVNPEPYLAQFAHDTNHLMEV